MNISDLLKLAEKGDLNSQTELGRLYYDKENYDEAFKWLEKAALSGSAEAQYLLGQYYEKVIKNFVDGGDWYFKAASQNYTPAQICLSILYFTRYGVAMNHTHAYLWSLLALANLTEGEIQKRIKQFADNVVWYLKYAVDEEHKNGLADLWTGQIINDPEKLKETVVLP